MCFNQDFYLQLNRSQRNAIIDNVLLFTSLTGMEKVLTQESRQFVFLILIFPSQYVMPGENHLLHKSVSPGYMVLRGYKISWVSASDGTILVKSKELQQIMSVKDLAQLHLKIKRKKCFKILHRHSQVHTGIAKQLLQVLLKWH